MEVLPSSTCGFWVAGAKVMVTEAMVTVTLLSGSRVQDITPSLDGGGWGGGLVGVPIWYQGSRTL